MSINRRKFVKGALLLPAISLNPASLFANAEKISGDGIPFKRVRPGEQGWPTEDRWAELKKAVNGNLLKLESPWLACKDQGNATACNEVFKGLKNPYNIGDNPALTQSSGWLDAWQSEPSVYAVTAKSTADVVAAVNFARNHKLRLVVKGGGHSYQVLPMLRTLYLSTQELCTILCFTTISLLKVVPGNRHRNTL